MPPRKATATSPKGALVPRSDATPSMSKRLSSKHLFRLHPQRTWLLIDRYQYSDVQARASPAILNTENSFDLKTIEGGQMAMEGLHGFKNKDIEKVSYRSPEFYFRA